MKGENMDEEHIRIMEYVNKHPYQTIMDVANALNMTIETVEAIAKDLQMDWKILIVHEHYHPQYGFIPYDSPMLEPEVDSK
jgi:DNA-binding Lrp family transcriptional regulator